MKFLFGLTIGFFLTVGSAYAQTSVIQQCASGNPMVPWTPCPTSSSGGAVTQGTTPWVVSQQPTGTNIADTPTIQNAAYASGNCMGGFQTIALGSAVSALSQISLASQGGLATAKQIYVFSANPSGSTCTDKSTFTIATADLAKLIYTGSITPAAPTGTTKTWGAASSLALPVPATIYVAIVETAPETPTSTTDLVLTFSAL